MTLPISLRRLARLCVPTHPTPHLSPWLPRLPSWNIDGDKLLHRHPRRNHTTIDLQRDQGVLRRDPKTKKKVSLSWQTSLPTCVG